MGPQMMMQGGGQGMAQMPMMRQMQEMHDQMGRIHATEDPHERRALLEKHMESMQGMMQMMHGMMGMMGGRGGMMGSGPQEQGGMHSPGTGMMGGQGGTAAPGGSNMQGMAERLHQRMNMMQDRMDTMQVLMEQMMENQREMLRNMPGGGSAQ